MKTTVTTFKTSGKWYDTFEVDLPKELKPFDKKEISEWLIENAFQCNTKNFIYTIDEVPQLVIHNFTQFACNG